MIRNIMLIFAVSIGFIAVGLWISTPAQPATPCFSGECFVGGDCEEDFHCIGDNCVCNNGRCDHATTDG